jgi:hemoglobin
MIRSARCCTICCSKDYWVGESEGSVRKDRQLIVDYLAAATGRPWFYTGRDIKEAHTGLGIAEREWELFVGHRQAMMNGFGVNAREQQDTLELLIALIGDLVQRQLAPIPGV